MDERMYRGRWNQGGRRLKTDTEILDPSQAEIDAIPGPARRPTSQDDFERKLAQSLGRSSDERMPPGLAMGRAAPPLPRDTEGSQPEESEPEESPDAQRLLAEMTGARGAPPLVTRSAPSPAYAAAPEPAAAPAAAPDRLEQLKGLLEKLKPAPTTVNFPEPQLPQGPNPKVLADTLDRARTLGLLHGAFGVRIPSTYEVMRSGSAQPQMMPSPSYDAAMASVMAPAQAEMARVQLANQRGDVTNKYRQERAKFELEGQKQDHAVSAAELKGALQSYLQSEQLSRKDRQLTETERENQSKDAARAGGATAKPPAKGGIDQIALLQATADHLANLKGVVGKHGSLGTLTAKIGPLVRAAQTASFALPDSMNPALKPENRSMLEDLELGESSMAGVIGSKALATEPRRVAYELQKVLNKELGQGVSPEVFKQQAGVIGRHIANNYRGQFEAHGDFYRKNRPDLPDPDEFERYIMDGLTPPGSATVAPKSTQGLGKVRVRQKGSGTEVEVDAARARQILGSPGGDKYEVVTQ